MNRLPLVVIVRMHSQVIAEIRSPPIEGLWSALTPKRDKFPFPAMPLLPMGIVRRVLIAFRVEAKHYIVVRFEVLWIDR